MIPFWFKLKVCCIHGILSFWNKLDLTKLHHQSTELLTWWLHNSKYHKSDRSFPAAPDFVMLENQSSQVAKYIDTGLRCHIVGCSSFGWHCLRFLGATRALYLAKWHCRGMWLENIQSSSDVYIYIFTSSIQSLSGVCLRTLFVERYWYWNRMHVVLEFKSWLSYLSLCDDAGQAKILRRQSEKHISNTTKAACLH